MLDDDFIYTFFKNFDIVVFCCRNNLKTKSNFKHLVFKDKFIDLLTYFYIHNLPLNRI